MNVSGFSPKRWVKTVDPPWYTPPGGASERAEGGQKQGGRPVFYRELWFAAVMAAVALVVLAIALAVVLNKALNRPPFTRERPPLMDLPLQKRRPMAVYPSTSYLFDSVPDTTGFSNSVTLKAFTLHEEETLDIKCEPALDDELGILNVSTLHGSAQEHFENSLRRSVSQVMDGKSLTEDDDVWDPRIRGHDSGMFMEDEEFVDTIKGFSTVRKEHTMFTDTNL